MHFSEAEISIFFLGKPYQTLQIEGERPPSANPPAPPPEKIYILFYFTHFLVNSRTPPIKNSWIRPPPALL